MLTRGSWRRGRNFADEEKSMCKGPEAGKGFGACAKQWEDQGGWKTGQGGVEECSRKVMQWAGVKSLKTSWDTLQFLVFILRAIELLQSSKWS